MKVLSVYFNVVVQTHIVKEKKVMHHTTTKGAIGSRLSMRRALPILHAAGAVLLVIAVTGPARGQSTGIAACDDFLTKYDTCVTSKLPEAQRATYKAQLDQTRKTWIDMAKNPSTKPAMEQSCKQTMDAIKTSLQGFGCSF